MQPRTNPDRLTTLLTSYRRSPSPETEAALWSELMHWTQHAARQKARSTGMPVEDLNSEFLIELVKAMPQAPDQEFPRWVNTVIRNRHLDIVKEQNRARRKTSRAISIQDVSDGHLPSFDPNPDSIDYESLPADVRPIADLILQGYTIAEISTKLGIPPETMRKRLQRLRD